jgi:hypothetical protein|tara:strand:- start:3 stop:362 length:360 start_codon:yes stop_codon:yes gene_type:complete
MVTYREIGKRHAAYFSALVLVISVSNYTWLLFSLLCALLAAVKWHHGSPLAFVALTFFSTPLLTGFVVKLSSHTWWYAHPVEMIGVPPWLFPLHSLLAHWVLDAYFLATLQEVRKITLP